MQDLDAIVWESDPLTMRFTFVSDRAQALLGFPLEAWVDFDFWASTIHPEDRAAARELCLRETRAGRDHDFEYRTIAADGSVVWLRDMVRLIVDENGTLVSLRGLMVDITERKRAEAEQAALRRVATAVATGTPADQLFDLVAREVAGLLSVEAGAVWRFEGERTVCAGSWGVPAARVGASFPLAQGGALAQVAATGHAGRTRYADLDPHDPGALRAGSRSLQCGVAAPVRAGGRLWGAVLALTASQHELPAGSEERLERFAELVALAIANAEDRMALARRAAAQDALRRVATAAATTAESHELYALVCREAAELLGAEAAGVVRIADHRRGRVLASWATPGARVPEAGRSVGLRAVAWTALRTGVPVRFGPDDAEPAGDEPWRSQYPRGMIAPIRVLGEPWGILTVVSTRGPIGVGAEDHLRDFADLVAAAAIGARQRRTLSEHAREQEALRLLTTMAVEGAEPSAVLSAAAGQAAALLDVQRGLVARFTENGAEVVGVAGPDQPGLGTVFPLDGEGAVARVARTGVTARVEDYAPPAPAGPGWTPTGRRTGLAAPVRAGGRLWGAVLASATEPEALPAGLEERLERFASVMGVAVASAEDRAELAARAASDPLTGLANHRTFQERLRDEFERAQRHRRQLSLALFDIDHFKRTNDRHGHQMGDRLLVAVARKLQGGARPGDLVARVGGDELAWILPEADGLDGWQAAERLRQEIAEMRLPDVGEIGVSVGICEVAHARDPGDLYRLADGALYWAKAHGRGACFRYTPEVVAVLSAEERAERLERQQALTSVRLLARVVDAKDSSTRRHSERVAETAGRLASALGWPSGRVAALREAGLVHDVGKVGVPDAVLFKPGRLTPVEYDQVKGHASLGAQLVSEVLSADQISWVRHHHERIDGTGYPDGLGGHEIPEGARILAVADAWDVMTNVRQYKLPMAIDEALDECRRESGLQFCTSVVAALEHLSGTGTLDPTPGYEPEPARNPAG